MLLSWTIYSRQWGPFGAAQFAPHFIQWNLCSSMGDTDQGPTNSSRFVLSAWPYNLSPCTCWPPSACRHRGTELPAYPVSWIPLQIWWSHFHWGKLASLESEVAQLGCRESGCSVLSICTWQAARCHASWARLNHHQHAAISPWSHLLAVGRCQSVLLSHHRALLEGEAGETRKALDLPFSLVAKIGGYWETDPFKPPLSTIKQQIAQVWRWCALRCRANGKVSILGNPYPHHCHLSCHFGAGVGLLPLPSAHWPSVLPKSYSHNTW